MTSRPEGAKEAVTRERIARVGQAAFERNAVGRTIPENWLKAADAILALCVEYAREQLEDQKQVTEAYKRDLKEDWEMCHRLHAEDEANILDLRAQLQTLRGALKQYGRHTDDCGRVAYNTWTQREPPELNCTCGLFAAIAENP